MVTIYQKPLINLQRIKRKKSKYITEENKKNHDREKDNKGSEGIFRNKHKMSRIGKFIDTKNSIEVTRE